MSYIYENSGRYYIGFYYQGKQHRRALGFRSRSGERMINKHHAEEIQLTIDLDLKRGKWPAYFSKVTAGRSVAAFKDYYIQNLAKQRHKFSENTLRNYGYAFDHLIEVVDPRTDLADIDSAVIHRDLLPHLEANYAWNTIRGSLIALKAAWNRAIKWQMVKVNPFEGLNTKPKKRIPKFYTADEVQVIREYCANPDISDWLGDIIFLVLNTGLRRHEVVTLVWPNINLSLGSMTFLGKGDKEAVIPLNSAALEILRKRPRKPNNQRVFWEIENFEAFATGFKRLRKRTGLGGNIHQLRKTFACHFMMNGGSIYDLQKLLRHESLDTLNVYVTLSPDYLKSAVQKVNFNK